jgi:hypothetical protein
MLEASAPEAVVEASPKDVGGCIAGGLRIESSRLGAVLSSRPVSGELIPPDARNLDVPSDSLPANCG